MGCADTASSGRRAFTLVEAMISVMVVAVLGGGILVMWPAIAQLNTLEQERAYAFQLACQQMEASVMVPDFPRIANHQTALVWDNGTPNNPADDTTGTVDVIVRDAKTGALIPTTPGTLNPNLWYRVEVTVSWHPRGTLSGKMLRETVMTYVVP